MADPSDRRAVSLEAFLGRVDAEAVRIIDTGQWTRSDEVALEAAFERAAVASLRAPVLAERSIVLRRVAKRVVPTSLRPLARQGVTRLDALSRRVVERLAKARGQ